MQRQFNVRIQISKRANRNGTKDAEITGSNMNDIKDGNYDASHFYPECLESKANRFSITLFSSFII
jgi:hypothetical protein